MFKTFLILCDDMYYLISTYNNKITIIRGCLAFEDTWINICKKLAFSPEYTLPYQVLDFFNSVHKTMWKKAPINWQEDEHIN
jgi:hypothetical protein